MYNRDMKIASIMLADYGSALVENISRWNVVMGIVFMALALITVFCIKPIVEKSKMADKRKDKIIMTVRIIALIIAFGGALACCF